MAYFDDVKIDDRVWSFEYDWGEVSFIGNESFKVDFPNSILTYIYSFEGVLLNILNGWGENIDIDLPEKQTLFWNEIKYKIPEKSRTELKEGAFSIDIQLNGVVRHTSKLFAKSGLTRVDEDTARRAVKQIKKFTRLLALRDQECPNSKGYEFISGNNNWCIYFNYLSNKYTYKNSLYEKDIIIYFKTKEDAELICNILNSGRFDLEGD